MKKIILSILVLVCQQTLMSQGDTPPAFLWKVNINGSEFHLAGSIHAGPEEPYSFPKAYLDAYQHADFVILELKEDFESLQDLLFSYAAKDSLSEDQYLDKHLSQDSKEMLASLFKGREETLERYYRHEGWLLHMAISGMKSKLIGYDPEKAVDRFFHELATGDQKSILGLDQIETQLRLFEFEVPLEHQVQIIESALKGAEPMARAEHALFDSYFQQDREAFREAFLKTMNLENPQIRAMYDMVFVRRNKTWVQKLIDLSTSQAGSYFMLVGCGHYFGPENVLELLEAEGFVPRQVR